jgi:hypothetical protein
MGKKNGSLETVNKSQLKILNFAARGTSSCRPSLLLPEYNAGHIKGADNVFVGSLLT